MNKFLKSILAGIMVITSTPIFAIETSSLLHQDQVECLAKAVYFEAGNQSEAGKSAVAHVVMNRVRSTRFPGTPCGVIYQRTGRVCQFSWVCSGTRGINRISYNSSLRVAQMVYNGQIPDNTSGSMFFHNTSINPRWGKRPVVRIGSHIFYR